MTRRLPFNLRRDIRGVTLVEFALILPVMLMVMMGFWELCYRYSVQSALTGAVQDAGRLAALEGATPERLASYDKQVVAAVRVLAPDLKWQATRKSYRTFSEISPEPYSDTNKNNRRDPGECFSDVNGNGAWDADPGKAGQGGARDTTVYTMTITYSQMMPVSWLFGVSPTQEVSARTIVKNQPYGTQNDAAPPTVCTP